MRTEAEIRERLEMIRPWIGVGRGAEDRVADLDWVLSDSGPKKIERLPYSGDTLSDTVNELIDAVNELRIKRPHP